jgi:putative ABC transport system permease protein
MGVRLALGAAPAAVRGMVIREGLTLCALGVTIGVSGALAIGQVAEHLLFGVATWDVPTYATVLVVIVTTVMLACWLPAMRASRVSPTVALRAE